MGDTGGMGVESVLLRALTVETGPVADACLQWLVDGTAPAWAAIDVAWPRADVD